jgi:hypothetical protein
VCVCVRGVCFALRLSVEGMVLAIEKKNRRKSPSRQRSECRQSCTDTS